MRLFASEFKFIRKRIARERKEDEEKEGKENQKRHGHSIVGLRGHEKIYKFFIMKEAVVIKIQLKTQTKKRRRRAKTSEQKTHKEGNRNREIRRNLIGKFIDLFFSEFFGTIFL